jgi:formamidopyrimidine-DNA glycosylase
MPELPDVEVMRRYFDATALHQEIDQVRVNDTYSRRFSHAPPG